MKFSIWKAISLLLKARSGEPKHIAALILYLLAYAATKTKTETDDEWIEKVSKLMVT